MSAWGDAAGQVVVVVVVAVAVAVVEFGCAVGVAAARWAAAAQFG